MKKGICLTVLLLNTMFILAQINLPQYPDSFFSTYYHQRLTHFKSLPQTKNDIIFIGNSITDGGEWSELFNDLSIKNRGISGDISAGVINRLDEIIQRKPSKVFLLIGTNDLSRNITQDSLIKNILLISSYLKQKIPSSKFYVQSILPVSNAFNKFQGHTNKADQIKKVNESLKENAEKYDFTFIDLFSSFLDSNGKLSREYTNDGLHLSGKGYLLWKHLVFPYVYGLQQKASLIPQPQKIQWKAGSFPLYELKSIIVNNPAISKEALLLQSSLQKMGLVVSVNEKVVKQEKTITIKLEKISVPMYKEEAYALEINNNEVLLKANTTLGIFNGIQTLLQLARDGVMIPACSIADWPSFAWRGYMIDVGRNYMSMELLKQQIDIMSKYKLNVFHFHATEDVAWRIASKQYPQLTAPEHMLRNKGMYYSEEEVKELIAYCKDRYITFVPEIDMPGHSAAFKRAMGFDMQSDSGLIVVKNILKEFISTYDLPYMHIGADEVKINNKAFVPEVTRLVQSMGKKVIGWEPGGNFTDNTIRQLWMDDNGKITGGKNIQYIDSRHLYLNHMDPLESVTTIFNRKIGNKPHGDENTLGGTLCTWHDRAVGSEKDILRMNPVYPGMLAFAERIWKGGGQEKWIANIDEGHLMDFIDFEKRLLDHRKIYFNEETFPYVQQSGIKWSLYGPFSNTGDLSKKFAPESSSFDPVKTKPNAEARGGTMILRHWWDPLIKGALQHPEDSTTWYAHTKIWSDEEGEKDFWIGFNNISRSPATDSPPANSWDAKSSSVWVNGKLIAPPRWKRASQKGHSEIPLTDEGYEYRDPTKIFLKKGWNSVLVKAPIGSFKGKDWQNPVKWMFTFLPINLQ